MMILIMKKAEIFILDFGFPSTFFIFTLYSGLFSKMKNDDKF